MTLRLILGVARKPAVSNFCTRLYECDDFLLLKLRRVSVLRHPPHKEDEGRPALSMRPISAKRRGAGAAGRPHLPRFLNGRTSHTLISRSRCAAEPWR